MEITKKTKGEATMHPRSGLIVLRVEADVQPTAEEVSHVEHQEDSVRGGFLIRQRKGGGLREIPGQATGCGDHLHPCGPVGTIYADFGIPMNSMETFCTTMVSEGEKTLAEFTERHFSGMNHRAKVTCGDFSEEILNFAKEEQADMIVMGTHGRKGMDRLLFGSVAEKVLRQAPCPVVAVRPS